jgi:pimeloyl-ACP methyl ester carboxylesterase
LITFQFRASSIKRLTRNNHAFVNTIYHRWSPNWDFTESDLAPVKQSLSHPGVVEAALGYYWSYKDIQNDQKAKAIRNRRTTVPTLTLVGQNDAALDINIMAATIDAFSGPYQYQVLPKAGHFLHRESPELVLKYILDFLGE